MKLTICQFSKLFLLLTAFFYILDQCNVLPASAIVTIKAETVSIVYDEDDDKNNNKNNNNHKDIKKFAKAKELYSSEIFRNLENSLETTTRTTTVTLVDKLEDTLTKDEVSSLMKTLDNKQEQEQQQKQQQQPEQQKQNKQVSTIITTNERIAKDLNIGKSIEKLSKHNQSLYVRLKGSINKSENKKNNNKNDNDNHNDSSNDYYNIDKNDDENNTNNNNNNNNDEDEYVNAKDNKASDVHSMTAAAGIDLKILSAHKLTTLVRDVENQQHFMASKQKATTKATIIPSSTIILSNDFIWQKSKRQQQEQPQYKLRSSPTPLPSPSPSPSPSLSSLASTLMPANEITSTSTTTSASSSESRQNLPSSSMLHSNTNCISSNSGNGSRSYRHTANTIKLQRQHQQEQKEQQVEREHQRQHQHQQQQEQQQHNSQHQHEQRVGVLVSSALLNRMHVQQGFRNFMEFFQVNFKNVTVDFLLDDDWRHFVKLLEGNYYTMLVKTLNTGVDLHIGDNDNDISNYSDADDSVANNHSQREVLQSQQRDDDEMKTKTKSYDSLQQQQKLQQQQRSSNIGYCRLGKELARDFNKTVLLWPCPHIKESGSFLPSYEAISFAVKSIANKLNWTQVDIYVGDENWALPMTIAANLHIPYKIVMGEDNIHSLHGSDKIGKAIILTAVMNDISTLRLLNKLETLLYTKVLLIDIMATSFNAKNQFYKHLSRINPRSSLMSNLLLLTVLSDNYRHFLNVAFEDNGIQMVQNFRQLKRLKTIAITDSQHNNDSLEYWPNAKVLSQYFSSTTTSSDDKMSQLYLSDINHTNFTYKWLKACSSLNFFNIHDNRHICQHQEQIIENCWLYLRNEQRKVNQREISTEHLIKDLRKLFTQQLCRKQTLYDEQSSTVTKTKTTTATTTTTTAAFENIKRDQQLIANLREFIDFFNFYDFLIANILANKPANASQPRKHHQQQQQQQHQRHVPKYDFIVLDVVLTDDGVYGNGDSNTSQYNRINNTSSNNLLNAFNWRPLLILELHEINLKTYITHSIQPGFDDWLLVTNVQLWHCNTICWIIIAVCVGFLLFIVVASVAAGIALRNYLLKKRLSKGPNKIVLSANDFVFPVDSRRVDDGIEAMLRCWLQQLQEFGGPEVDKPDLLKGSIGSLKNLGFIIPGASTNATNSAGVNNATTNGKSSNTGANHLARHNPALLDMRARYNGDLVQLKEIQMNSSTELKAKAMDLLVMAHGLRHENINPLIGWLADPNRTAMVFDFCSRGSLQDVLIMDEIKLDWSFRLSLLTDLVRGMRYLHSSPLRIHGTLTSRNCVVDARWVLKITDYGLPLFYEAQGIQSPQRTAKELLWTAPELLRAMKPQPTPSHTHQQQQQQQQQHQQHHHHHHYSYHLTHHARALMGTPAGDVYSFGIIMQEVVVRGEPYCMLSLSADEIIAKIKKPPPLIRPSVSKGAAPPEAINIMRQCWAEQPEMRPDFNSVYERFKLLNHGRKVNFVDTMFQMLEKYSNNLEELIRERTEQLDMERKKTEQLLNRMLPSSVAEKLKMGLAVEPEEFSDVTIYFSDIVGFTTIAAHCTPVQVVDLLNDLYTIFDATINAYNVYKVETIGDAYMVVSGLPVRIPDHAEQIATMALDLLHQSGRFNVKHLPGVPLQLRIGLHTGPCCAGVVGLTMPRYCLFGDTVNTASRMESTGSSWRIHMSQETRDRLETRGGYMIEPRGLIDIKGKGMMSTFWLLGKKGFEKPLPNPPPIGESHGLDESLIRNSITLKALANKSRNSTNPSSSQSSSLAGEAVEVKVEITPPANAEVSSNHLQNSYSLDSNSTTTISPNMNLCPEFPSKTPSSSPQSRKISDATSAANVPEHLLCSTVNFNRLPSSAGGSSSRLYKKIEEMLDLSSPYNHYKCLSPSESNLSQFYDGKYIYSTSGGSGSGGNTTTVLANVINLHSAGPRFEKPGSSRLLRRQFSLDRDDTHNKGEYQLQHQHPHQGSLQTSYTLSLSTKSSLLDIPILQENARSPKVSLARIHKQNSSSIAQDLEKIEEIPLSPASSQQHSSLDSNMNKSPPSTIETSIPPLHKPIQYTGSISPPHLQSQGKQITKTSTLFSAPTSPAPSRSLNGISYITGAMESPTTDASTATTSASVTSTQSTPGDDPLTAKKSEISLNVEALLSR